MDSGLNIRTGLNKHGYHTLCLEAAQGFEIENMTITQQTNRFAKNNLTRIATTENDAKNGYEAEDGDNTIFIINGKIP